MALIRYQVLKKSPLSVFFRCYCSQETEAKNAFSKGSTSTIRADKAQAMARLIDKRPWSGELESSLALFSPSLSKTRVFQILNLVKSPSKALHFFNWAQEKLGFHHDQHSYFLMLEILGRGRNFNAARNFLFSIERKSNGVFKLEDKYFNSLIRSYGQAGLFQESIKLFETMKSMGVSPSIITFNNIFSILLKRGRTNMVKNLYDEMLTTYGVTPDTYTFNILIRGFCMNSMVDEGFRLFKQMSQFNCEPDVITYNCLVDGLCRAGKVKIAHNVVKGMKRKSSGLNPNVVTYTTLIRGYCMKREIDGALHIFQEMISQGLTPSKITYNILIKGLCEAQKLNKIKDIFEGKMGREFVPDICTFNTLMQAHCGLGNLHEAMKVFENMSKLCVSPDSATYSVLIRSFCENGEFGKAEELFDELAETEILLRNAGCTPLVAAYNPIFEYLCKCGKTKKAEKVFRQLMKKGVQDPISYKTLIMGHCRERAFEAGYDLLVLMLRRAFVPDYETYQFLIDGLLHENNPLLAHKCLQKMLKSSHHPKSSTYHSILAELLKKDFALESASVVMLMLEKYIRQNINLSTETVRLLFVRGESKKAFEIVRLLYQNGYMVAIEELIKFLYQKEKLLEAHEMLLINLEKDPKIDIKVCSMVIAGLCSKKRVSEAFSLFYKVVEKEGYQELGFLEELRAALLADGRETEANFVSKRIPQQRLYG